MNNQRKENRGNMKFDKNQTSDSGKKTHQSASSQPGNKVNPDKKQNQKAEEVDQDLDQDQDL